MSAYLIVVGPSEIFATGIMCGVFLGLGMSVAIQFLIGGRVK